MAKLSGSDLEQRVARATGLGDAARTTELFVSEQSGGGDFCRPVGAKFELGPTPFVE